MILSPVLSEHANLGGLYANVCNMCRYWGWWEPHPECWLLRDPSVCPRKPGFSHGDFRLLRKWHVSSFSSLQKARLTHPLVCVSLPFSRTLRSTRILKIYMQQWKKLSLSSEWNTGTALARSEKQNLEKWHYIWCTCQKRCKKSCQGTFKAAGELKDGCLSNWVSFLSLSLFARSQEGAYVFE